ALGEGPHPPALQRVGRRGRRPGRAPLGVHRLRHGRRRSPASASGNGEGGALRRGHGARGVGLGRRRDRAPRRGRGAGGRRGRRMKHSAARLAQEIHGRLAQILRERTADPRLELLSLTEVKVAPDASFARIFYRTLGDKAETVAALEKAKPYLRRRLAGELRVRRVPELDFRPDDTLDRAEHLEGVLRDLARERSDRDSNEPESNEGEGQ